MSQLKSRPPAPAPQPSGNGSRIRVVIVENHQLVSESLGLLLDAQADMEVVGKAISVHEAAVLPRQLAPDVVVMDFHLDDGTGRDAALLVRQTFPNTRFVFLSRDGSDDARLAAVEAGASAYVLKSDPASSVIEAVRNAARGVSMISPAAIARLVSRGKDRAHAVVHVLQDLWISYATVRTHIRSISGKLGTHSVVNAVVTARQLELIN